MSDDKLDISGIDKAELLAALYNSAHPLGFGFMRFKEGHQMTTAEAREIIDTGANPDYAGARNGLYFDYLHGRVIKCRLDDDTMRPDLYDRDNGKGAAAKVVAKLRAAKVAP